MKICIFTCLDYMSFLDNSEIYLIQLEDKQFLPKYCSYQSIRHLANQVWRWGLWVLQRCDWLECSLCCYPCVPTTSQHWVYAAPTALVQIQSSTGDKTDYETHQMGCEESPHTKSTCGRKQNKNMSTCSKSMLQDKLLQFREKLNQMKK